MPYSRVDIGAMCEKYKALTDKVKNAGCKNCVFGAIDEHEKLQRHISSMSTLAYIRHSINTKDEFYDKENQFYDTEGPVLSESVQEFMNSLLESKFLPDVKEKYGSLLFINMEMELKTFKPEIIPLLQKENTLVSDYQKLIASAEIPYDGKILNTSQLTPYKEHPDREMRRGAYFADGKFYMEHADELDSIFDSLVKVRTEIAHKLGFKSFTELAYLRRTRNCYDPEMVAKFREQVVEDIVPIVCSLKAMQAERIGIAKEDMRIYDDNYKYKDGNPKPKGTPEDILAAGKRMYEEMSPETAKFINFMYDNELLDVEAKPGKAVGGYCTEIPEYGAPFIFSNFNGTTGDVDVLTHEAGHAYAAYQNMDADLLELAQPTMESCECHSMSMEFLAWPWLKLYYGEDVDRAKFSHLESSLTFIPYGCLVDHFQHVVYDNPELTPAERHQKWNELEAIYRPYLKADGVPFWGEGRLWQRQLHIYHYPFYYIDYCLAQTISLIFWELSQKDYKDAWRRYNAFVNEGGRKTFVELCKTAELSTPFEEGSLKAVASAAKAWLDERK